MTVTMEEAQKMLPELIGKLSPGEELIITRGSLPVAQVLPLVVDGGESAVAMSFASTPQYGSCKGKLLIHSDDDEHLNDFKEYMP